MECSSSVSEQANVYSSHVQLGPLSVNFQQHLPAVPYLEGARQLVEPSPSPRKPHEQVLELLVPLLHE